MDASTWESLGLYDPADEHAKLRLELLKYLTSLGATTDELIGYRDALPALAMVLAVRGGAAMTLHEAAIKSGLPEHDLRRLVRAAGFPDPDPNARVFTDGFVALASGLGAVSAIFGEDSLYQLIRVLGSSMARVADAVVSAFLVNVEPAARRQDPIGLAVAKANVEAAALLPMVAPALDVLFRQHLVAAQRTTLADEDLVGYETQRLTVGFVDLVGSTELAESLTMRELGSLLTTFEHLATDTVTATGGRVIKLIGDEIMYSTTSPSAGCQIALELCRLFRAHPTVPPVRAGVAMGPVMLRDGDAFGPVVNLAARIVKTAGPGEVLATADLAAAAGLDGDYVTPQQLKGISVEIDLKRLRPA